jgi:hypothetical protein
MTYAFQPDQVILRYKVNLRSLECGFFFGGGCQMFKLRRGSHARKASEPQVKKLRAMHNYFFFTSSRNDVQFRAKYEFLLGLLFYIFLFVSLLWSVGGFFEPLRCNVLSFHTCVGMKHLTSVAWHSRTNKAPTCCRKCKHSLLCVEGVVHVSEETLVEYRARIA